MNIGLFYGSSTCYTEMAAEKIRDIIGPELVTLHNLKDDSPALMSQYDVLILGIPTWDFGEIQETGRRSGSNWIPWTWKAKSSHCTAWAISWAMANGSLTHWACCTTSWRPKA